MLADFLSTLNVVVFVEGKYLSSPLYFTLTSYSPLGNPDITNLPLPPLTATVSYSSPLIRTVTFPVASDGTAIVITSFSST